ncbi:MAG: type I DNA topoisomerase [Dehalococcoidia bacterium]|nr:type I DNA topoisomerase [Dehalococcoidia bacterium]
MTTAPESRDTRASGPIARRVSARNAAPVSDAPARRGRARNLVIVESPAKARTVENILGSDYRVIASVGHVRDLPNYGYGVEDFETFRPKYVVVKDKKRGVDKTDVIDQIASAARSADRVYLSTDPDREGEAISWHIREAAGIPAEKTSRVVFHEITKPAIEDAFRHPGTLNMDLVDAQQTRRVLDRLIGFPLTWFVQGKVSKAASAGRVQSVALRLIVDRELLIRDFRATQYWTISAGLSQQAGAAAPAPVFSAELARLPGMPRGTTIRPGTGEFTPAIPDQAAADRLIETFNRSAFTVSSVKKGQRSKSPAPPFTTSTFQQAANNRLGMGASRAMSIAQQLYEGVDVGSGPVGLITYMRTDSVNISPVARGEARGYIGRRWGADFVPQKERVYSTRSKGAQEAHEAIRPTDPARTPDDLRRHLSAEQHRVYQLIWQRFMASQMADARFSTVAVEIEAKEGATLRGTFRSSAQQLIFAGHLAVYGVDANEREAGQEDEDAEASLPELSEGETLARRSVDGRQHFTEPPPRYTEASLVKALEELGIGRPSTYATIVQTVQKREYVKKEGRALVPLELGFLVNEMLVEHLGRYVDTGFTSAMEEDLDEIAEGKREYVDVVREFWSAFEKDIEKAKGAAEKQQEETDIRCTLCGEANMVIKWGRNGKFLACPRYPECKNAMPVNEAGEPVPVAQPTVTAYDCPKCGAATIQKSGPYGPYIDCVRREENACDFRAGVPVGVACPECIDPPGQMVEKQARSGKRGTFYACWNYPNCSFTLNAITPGMKPEPRAPEAMLEANRKLLERSARGKAAFAARKAGAREKRKEEGEKVARPRSGSRARKAS